MIEHCCSCIVVGKLRRAGMLISKYLRLCTCLLCMGVKAGSLETCRCGGLRFPEWNQKSLSDQIKRGQIPMTQLLWKGKGVLDGSCIQQRQVRKSSWTRYMWCHYQSESSTMKNKNNYFDIWLNSSCCLFFFGGGRGFERTDMYMYIQTLYKVLDRFLQTVAYNVTFARFSQWWSLQLAVFPFV